MNKAAIGLLGGSFNPPHEGHRALVQHAMRRLSLGGMRVLVTPQNPLKDAGAYAPLPGRIAATREILRGLPQVRVEAEAHAGPVYAIDSVRKVLARAPGQAFVYVMGADSFAGLHCWHRWRELMHLLPIAVVSRPGFRLEALHSTAALTFRERRIAEGQLPSLAFRKAPAWGYLPGLARPESSSEIRANEKPSS